MHALALAALGYIVGTVSAVPTWLRGAGPLSSSSLLASSAPAAATCLQPSTPAPCRSLPCPLVHRTPCVPTPLIGPAASAGVIMELPLASGVRVPGPGPRKDIITIYSTLLDPLRLPRLLGKVLVLGGRSPRMLLRGLRAFFSDILVFALIMVHVAPSSACFTSTCSAATAPPFLASPLASAGAAASGLRPTWIPKDSDAQSVHWMGTPVLTLVTLWQVGSTLGLLAPPIGVRAPLRRWALSTTPSSHATPTRSVLTRLSALLHNGLAQTCAIASALAGMRREDIWRRMQAAGYV